MPHIPSYGGEEEEKAEFGNMQTTAEGNHFASAYFCRGILPKDLILEELVKYERPLIRKTECEECL